MDFAVVELKYVEKRMFIVPIANIQSSKPKASAVDAYFCYISTDLTDEPDFNAKYFEKYDGSPGLFRVFIKKITKTYEEALSFIKDKRMQIVPKKYREPSNTDSELKAAAAKRKRAQNQILKADKKNANSKNSAHLTELLSVANSDSLTNGSTFEELVKRTLEDTSNSDSDSENSENANYDESDLHQNQGESKKTRNELTLTCNSASNSVSLPNNRHSLGQKSSNQYERSKASSDKSKHNIKSDKTPGIQMLTLPFMLDDAEKINGMTMKANSVATNRTVTPEPTINRKIATHEMHNRSLPQTIPSLADMKRKMRNPEGTLQLTERSEKQTVMSTVHDKNVVKTVSNQTLLKSKDKQGNKVHNVSAAKSITKTTDSRFQTKNDIPPPNTKVAFNVSEVINIDELGTREIPNRTSPHIIPSLADSSKGKMQNPEGTLQLRERSEKQTVMPTVHDKNVVKTVSNQTLLKSKDKQDKQKINTVDVFKAQKSKAAHTDDVSAANSTTKTNDSRSQPKIDTPTPNAELVFNVSEVINIDQMIKQKETLETDYVNLKRENETLKERNDVLQSALVTASKSAAQVSFVEEDGGRRYCENTRNVFLTAVQCKILDAIDDDKVYLNYLIVVVLGTETLKTSTVTGRPSNRTKGAGSTAYDPTKLKFIYNMMASRTNNSPLYTRSKINVIINKKRANLLAAGKPRSKRKIRVVENDLDLPDDISERVKEGDTFDMVNNAGSQDLLNTSEFVNTSENTNSSEEYTDSHEATNSPEPTNPCEPSEYSSRPADATADDASLMINDTNFGDDYLMYDINDLNLVDQSAFENTNFVYIENAETQPGTGQYVYLPK